MQQSRPLLRWMSQGTTPWKRGWGAQQGVILWGLLPAQKATHPNLPSVPLWGVRNQEVTLTSTHHSEQYPCKEGGLLCPKRAF